MSDPPLANEGPTQAATAASFSSSPPTATALAQKQETYRNRIELDALRSAAYHKFSSEFHKLLLEAKCTPPAEWSKLATLLSSLTQMLQSSRYTYTYATAAPTTTATSSSTAPPKTTVHLLRIAPLLDTSLFVQVLTIGLDARQVLGVQRKTVEVLQAYLSCCGVERAAVGAMPGSTHNSSLVPSPLVYQFPFLMEPFLLFLPQAPVQLWPAMLSLLQSLLQYLFAVPSSVPPVIETTTTTPLPSLLLPLVPINFTYSVLSAVLVCLSEPEGSSIHRMALQLLLALYQHLVPRRMARPRPDDPTSQVLVNGAEVFLSMVWQTAETAAATSPTRRAALFLLRAILLSSSLYRPLYVQSGDGTTTAETGAPETLTLGCSVATKPTLLRALTHLLLLPENNNNNNSNNNNSNNHNNNTANSGSGGGSPSLAHASSSSTATSGNPGKNSRGRTQNIKLLLEMMQFDCPLYDTERASIFTPVEQNHLVLSVLLVFHELQQLSEQHRLLGLSADSAVGNCKERIVAWLCGSSLSALWSDDVGSGGSKAHRASPSRVVANGVAYLMNRIKGQEAYEEDDDEEWTLLIQSFALRELEGWDSNLRLRVPSGADVSGPMTAVLIVLLNALHGLLQFTAHVCGNGGGGSSRTDWAGRSVTAAGERNPFVQLLFLSDAAQDRSLVLPSPLLEQVAAALLLLPSEKPNDTPYTLFYRFFTALPFSCWSAVIHQELQHLTRESRGTDGESRVDAVVQRWGRLHTLLSWCCRGARQLGKVVYREKGEDAVCDAMVMEMSCLLEECTLFFVGQVQRAKTRADAAKKTSEEKEEEDAATEEKEIDLTFFHIRGVQRIMHVLLSDFFEAYFGSIRAHDTNSGSDDNTKRNVAAHKEVRVVLRSIDACWDATVSWMNYLVQQEVDGKEETAAGSVLGSDMFFSLLGWCFSLTTLLAVVPTPPVDNPVAQPEVHMDDVDNNKSNAPTPASASDSSSLSGNAKVEWVIKHLRCSLLPPEDAALSPPPRASSPLRVQLLHFLSQLVLFSTTGRHRAVYTSGKVDPRVRQLLLTEVCPTLLTALWTVQLPGALSARPRGASRVVPPEEEEEEEQAEVFFEYVVRLCLQSTQLREHFDKMIVQEWAQQQLEAKPATLHQRQTSTTHDKLVPFMHFLLQFQNNHTIPAVCANSKRDSAAIITNNVSPGGMASPTTLPRSTSLSYATPEYNESTLLPYFFTAYVLVLKMLRQASTAVSTGGVGGGSLRAPHHAVQLLQPLLAAAPGMAIVPLLDAYLPSANPNVETAACLRAVTTTTEDSATATTTATYAYLPLDAKELLQYVQLFCYTIFPAPERLLFHLLKPSSAAAAASSSSDGDGDGRDGVRGFTVSATLQARLALLDPALGAAQAAATTTTTTTTTQQTDRAAPAPASDSASVASAAEAPPISLSAPSTAPLAHCLVLLFFVVARQSLVGAQVHLQSLYAQQQQQQQPSIPTSSECEEPANVQEDPLMNAATNDRLDGVVSSIHLFYIFLKALLSSTSSALHTAPYAASSTSRRESLPAVCALCDFLSLPLVELLYVSTETATAVHNTSIHAAAETEVDARERTSAACRSLYVFFPVQNILLHALQLLVPFMDTAAVTLAHNYNRHRPCCAPLRASLFLPCFAHVLRVVHAHVKGTGEGEVVLSSVFAAWCTALTALVPYYHQPKTIAQVLELLLPLLVEVQETLVGALYGDERESANERENEAYRATSYSVWGKRGTASAATSERRSILVTCIQTIHEVLRIVHSKNVNTAPAAASSPSDSAFATGETGERDRKRIARREDVLRSSVLYQPLRPLFGTLLRQTVMIVLQHSLWARQHKEEQQQQQQQEQEQEAATAEGGGGAYEREEGSGAAHFHDLLYHHSECVSAASSLLQFLSQQISPQSAFQHYLLFIAEYFHLHVASVFDTPPASTLSSDPTLFSSTHTPRLEEAVLLPLKVAGFTLERILLCGRETLLHALQPAANTVKEPASVLLQVDLYYAQHVPVISRHEACRDDHFRVSKLVGAAAAKAQTVPLSMACLTVYYFSVLFGTNEVLRYMYTVREVGRYYGVFATMVTRYAKGFLSVSAPANDTSHEKRRVDFLSLLLMLRTAGQLRGRLWEASLATASAVPSTTLARRPPSASFCVLLAMALFDTDAFYELLQTILLVAGAAGGGAGPLLTSTEPFLHTWLLEEVQRQWPVLFRILPFDKEGSRTGGASAASGQGVAANHTNPTKDARSANGNKSDSSEVLPMLPPPPPSAAVALQGVASQLCLQVLLPICQQSTQSPSETECLARAPLTVTALRTIRALLFVDTIHLRPFFDLSPEGEREKKSKKRANVPPSPSTAALTPWCEEAACVSAEDLKILAAHRDMVLSQHPEQRLAHQVKTHCLNFLLSDNLMRLPYHVLHELGRLLAALQDMNSAFHPYQLTLELFDGIREKCKYTASGLTYMLFTSVETEGRQREERLQRLSFFLLWMPPALLVCQHKTILVFVKEYMMQTLATYDASFFAQPPSVPEPPTWSRNENHAVDVLELVTREKLSLAPLKGVFFLFRVVLLLLSVPEAPPLPLGSVAGGPAGSTATNATGEPLFSLLNTLWQLLLPYMLVALQLRSPLLQPDAAARTGNGHKSKPGMSEEERVRAQRVHEQIKKVQWEVLKLVDFSLSVSASGALPFRGLFMDALFTTESNTTHYATHATPSSRLVATPLVRELWADYQKTKTKSASTASATRRASSSVGSGNLFLQSPAGSTVGALFRRPESDLRSAPFREGFLLNPCLLLPEPQGQRLLTGEEQQLLERLNQHYSLFAPSTHTETHNERDTDEGRRHPHVMNSRGAPFSTREGLQVLLEKDMSLVDPEAVEMSLACYYRD